MKILANQAVHEHASFFYIRSFIPLLIKDMMIDYNELVYWDCKFDKILHILAYHQMFRM